MVFIERKHRMTGQQNKIRSFKKIGRYHANQATLLVGAIIVLAQCQESDRAVFSTRFDPVWPAGGRYAEMGAERGAGSRVIIKS